jgi:hypothetical protein
MLPLPSSMEEIVKMECAEDFRERAEKIFAVKPLGRGKKMRVLGRDLKGAAAGGGEGRVNEGEGVKQEGESAEEAKGRQQQEIIMSATPFSPPSSPCAAASSTSCLQSWPGLRPPPSSLPVVPMMDFELLESIFEDDKIGGGVGGEEMSNESMSVLYTSV